MHSFIQVVLLLFNFFTTFWVLHITCTAQVGIALSQCHTVLSLCYIYITVTVLLSIVIGNQLHTSHKYLDLHTSWQVFHNNLYKLLTKLIELSAFSVIIAVGVSMQVCGRCSFLGISRYIQDVFVLTQNYLHVYRFAAAVENIIVCLSEKNLRTVTENVLMTPHKVLLY